MLGRFEERNFFELLAEDAKFGIESRASLVAAAAGEGLAPTLVHWLTVGLFVFIGLKQMNIGGAIVDYAFGAIAVGSAVAFALAFGLGGRDAAARKLAELDK